jgi:hypothetical protein
MWQSGTRKSIQFWSEFFTCEANVLALLQILGRFPGVNFQVVYTPISPNGRRKEEKICQTNFSPRGKKNIHFGNTDAVMITADVLTAHFGIH